MRKLYIKKMPLLIISFLIILDQLSKYIVRQWGGFYICNEGIAFGLEMPQVWIWIFILLFLAILLILNLKFKILNEFINFKFRNFNLTSNFNPPAGGQISNLGLILILAGAVSNMIDRLYFGCIIDFINIPFWPAIFNLADVFIMIGAIMVIYLIFKSKH